MSTTETAKGKVTSVADKIATEAKSDVKLASDAINPPEPTLLEKAVTEAKKDATLASDTIGDVIGKISEKASSLLPDAPPQEIEATETFTKNEGGMKETFSRN